MSDATGGRHLKTVLPCGLRTGIYIVAAYVLGHGLTSWLVKPLQEQLLPSLTIFASLMYLPHGVRVLTAWLCGWRAVAPLFVAAIVADVLFTPVEVREVLRPVIVQSWLVGALCAPLAFALLRWTRMAEGATSLTSPSWRWLLVAGLLASVFNSLGQTFVFSGLTQPDELAALIALYAFGDLVGLVVSTVALMIIFRWLRLRL